mgnify:CR=1 FL=1
MEHLLLYFSIAASVIAIVIVATIGIKAVRKKDVEDSTSFFLSNTSISKSEVVSTLVSTNTALALIVFWFSYLGWFYGLGVAFWLSLFWIMGLELFAFYQSKWKSFPTPNSDNNKVKYQTLHDYVTMNKGNAARRALAIVSILSFILMMTVELTRGIRVLDFDSSNPTTIDKDIIGFIVLIGAGIYAAIGGLKSVIKTDKIQWVITLVALFLALVISIRGIVGESGLFGIVFFPENISLKSFFLIPSQPYLIIGSAFSWSFWFIVTMDMWQRAAAAREIQIVTKKTRLILYPWFIFLTLTSVLIGVFVRVKLSGQLGLTFPAVNFLEILSNGIFDIKFVDYALFIIIFTGFITAMVSTLDTYFVAVSHSIYRDISQRSKNGIVEFERFSRLIVVFITFGIAVAIFPLFLLVSHSALSINSLLYLATSLPFVLLPAILFSAGKSKENNSIPLIFSVVLGLIATSIIIYFVLWKISNSTPEAIGQWYNIMYLAPMIASLCSLVGYGFGYIVKLIKKQK